MFHLNRIKQLSFHVFSLVTAIDIFNFNWLAEKFEEKLKLSFYNIYGL